MRMCIFVGVDARTCKMQMLMRKLKTLVDRLGSGPRIVGRLGSGVRVRANFQIFPLRMLPHSDIRVTSAFYTLQHPHVRKSVHPHYTPGPRLVSTKALAARTIPRTH